MAETLTKEDYIKMTIDAEIKPLELRYTAINQCFAKTPIAYRTETYINSVMMGCVTATVYKDKIAGTPEEEALFKWSIEEAIRNIREFEAKGRKPKFISVKCPETIIEKGGLYEIVKPIFDKMSFETPEKLCIEYPMSILTDPDDNKKKAVLDMKLLKIRTLIDGCGEDGFMTGNLIYVPADMVILSKKITALINDRDNPMVVSSFIGYINSMRVQFLANGIKNDDQCTAMSRAEAFGYIPGDDYQGIGPKVKYNMSLGEALEQREDED